MNALDPSSPDSIVHVIQLSLSPIFLLTAVASLLSVFTTRLARISDQVKALSIEAPALDEGQRTVARRKLTYLKRRTHALDAAVILGAVSGACTCGTVLALFFGILRESATLGLLLFLFGAAILCTIGALAAFLTEVMLASRGIRAAAVDSTSRLEW